MKVNTNQPHDYQSLRRMAIAATLLITAACTQLDPYAEQFPRVAIGDSRVSIIGLLGEPTSVNSIEVPFIKIEQLAWRPVGSRRVYFAYIFLGRVITKWIIY